MEKVRVRYAPSPTGLLHIGNARSALFNYLFAKHYGGDFIIRIEDTDVLRNVKDGEESQLLNLKWLGITWDEGPDIGGPVGPYHQLKRLDLYAKYANILLEKGLAYKDFRDGSEEYAIRFRVPKDTTYEFDDLVRGKLKFESKEIEDWIIIKDNGIPTYNFAVVIDDHLMKITHVLRGEEHITNTPKQIMVYQALGFKIPSFGHMTIIVNENKKKLSKRDKDVVQFISEYAKLGYLPNAIFNFISLLGFSPKSENEILSKEEIITLFDPKRLSKAPAMFDKEKLAYINSRYIKELTIEELATLARPYLEENNIKIISTKWLETLVGLLQDRLTYIAQIVEYTKEFFSQNFNIENEEHKFLIENNSKEMLKILLNEFKEIEFDRLSIQEAIKKVGVVSNTKGKQLFMPTRIATTGEMHGPSLPESLELLQKELVLDRIEKTIKKL